MRLAKLCANFANDKKAEGIQVLDMRKVVNFCDYFVLCTGNTDRQVRAVADGIDEGLSQKGLKISLKEGYREGHWVLLDSGTVVIHIFVKDLRDFYNLDYLWQEAKKVKWEK